MPGPFTSQVPTDITSHLDSTTYFQNVTTIADLVHAVRELQTRITAFNAANLTNQI
jgi:hypothetical protein